MKAHVSDLSFLFSYPFKLCNRVLRFCSVPDPILLALLQESNWSATSLQITHSKSSKKVSVFEPVTL